MRFLPLRAAIGIIPLSLALACSDSRFHGQDWTGGGAGGGGIPTPRPPQTDPGPNLFRPELGPTTVPSTRAPAIFGGTLLATADGTRAVAADPDRDQIYVVDLAKLQVATTIVLDAGSLPFRGVESAPGVVHFTLRGTGEVVTIDTTKGTTVWTAKACAEPRGIAFDDTKQTLAVACERGDVVSLAVADGALVQTVHTPLTSARDVFVEGDGFWVSDFRTARLFLVDAHGAVQRTMGTASSLFPTDFAWRTRKIGPNAFLVSHQTILASAPVSPSTPAAYGGSAPNKNCVPNESIVGTAVSRLAVGEIGTTMRVQAGTLPVDVAYEPVSKTVLLALAGNSWQPKLRKVRRFALGESPLEGCEPNPAPLEGEIVAAEFTPSGALLEQSREPALLHVTTPFGIPLATIALSSVSRRDTGSILFHASSGRHVACASCHAEGSEDGQTWLFQDLVGPVRKRRTPSLRGTIQGTAPYHWNGEEADLRALFTDVMTHRMDGPTLDDAQSAAFSSWLEQLPAPRRGAPADAPAVERGAVLFAGKGKCASCHGANGASPSSTLFDVGTGAELGPPSLVGVSVRLPLMHDGCAATLLQRFDPSCGGSAHGAPLSSTETGDVVAYLQSL